MNKLTTLLFVMIFVFVSIVTVSATWCDTDYAKRINVSVNNTGGSALSDYQVYVNLSSNPINETSMRIYNATSCTLRHHWTENETGGNSYGVWIHYSAITASSWTNNTAIYYDYSFASSASNGTNTFEFFDDFEGTSLDTTNKWDTPGSPNIAVANSEVVVTNVGANTVEGIHTKSTWQSGYAIRSKSMVAVSGDFVYLLDFCTANFVSPQSLIGYWTGQKSYVSYNVSHEVLATSNDFDSYQIHEIRRLSGSFAFYFNDILQATHTTHIPSGTDNLVAGIAMVYDANAQVKSDWILVRKYASPEPSASFGGEESGSLSITITSPQNNSYTNDNTTTFTGTTNEAANITYSVDGGENKTACNNCTSFSNTTQELSEGLHNITVYGVDYSNATDTDSEIVYFTVDITAPAIVTNLENQSQGQTWIYWNWTNPTDSDFNHTEVYINGSFYANVSKPTNHYNATGLNTLTLYEIQTRTVDHAGNINTTWVNDTAKTLEVSWWNSSWSYRQIISINNTAGDLTNYQVKIELNSTEVGANWNWTNEGNDTRFTDINNNSLFYWLESYNSTANTSTMWVNVTYLKNNTNTTIYLYYGNSEASSVSNGTNTFEFFDDGEQEKTGTEYSASRSVGSSIGFNGKCPRIVTADNGTWLMITRLGADGSWPTGHDGQVWIKRSYNSGETWTDHEKLSNDPYDAINAEFVKYPNGDIDIFYQRYNDSAGIAYPPNMVSRSTDNGSSWSGFTSAPIPLDAGGQVMWQEIAIGNDVYLAANGDITVPITTNSCFLYKTQDNGVSWTLVSNITTESGDGAYAEPGFVHLGGDEFVVVLRDDVGKAHTLQKRSTDWGQNWTTDGYIKDDGSVLPTIGEGTNVVLHQCSLWNKNKDGNDLDYVYMRTALYPGSYPRDEYAYFSTDNCSSWESRSLLRSSASNSESAIVFENSSFAKLFPSGNPITNDNISISTVYPLSLYGWTIIGGEYTYTNSKAYQGTYSLYGNSYSDRAYQNFTNSAIDGSGILEFDMYDNGGTYGAMFFSDQTDTDSITFGYYTVYSATYYMINYGAGYISLADTVTRSVGWHKFRMDAKADGSVEFWIDNDKSSTTAPAGELDTAERVHIWDYDNSLTWWDRIRVRKYASNEPSSVLGSEEDAPESTPVISNVQNCSLTPTSQYVNWTVNQTAHNRVLYSNESDLTPAYYSTWDNSTAAPNITLSALIASTQYWYQVWSYNVTNNSLSDNSSTLSFTTAASATSTLHIDNAINIIDDWGRDFNSNLSANVTTANASDTWMNFTNAEFTNTSLGWLNLTLNEWVNESHNVNSPITNVSVSVLLNASGATNDMDSFYYEITKRTNTATMDSSATQFADISETFYVNATCNEEYSDTFYGNANLLEDGVVVATAVPSVTDYVNFSWQESSSGQYNYTIKFYNLTHYDNATTLTYSNVTINATNDYIPPNPINLQNTTGNFWVNHTWVSGGVGNLTDSFNVSVFPGWYNTTLNTYYNDTGLTPHDWSNVTVWAFNSSGNGSLSVGSVSDDVQIPNNLVTLTVTQAYNKLETQTVFISDTLSSDADSDTPTYFCNRTDLFADFSTVTGYGNWTTGITDSGIYYVDIGVSDGWGSIDNKTLTITIADATPGTPSALANTTGNLWVNHTWSTGANTNTFNVSVNLSWINSSSNEYFNNTPLTAHAWSNISVYGFNSTSGELSSSVSQNTQIPNNIPVLSGLPDNTTDEDVNQTDIFDLDNYFTDTDGDTPTYLVESNNQSANVTVTINTSNNVSYTLVNGWNGTASIVINVTDGYGGEDNDTFLIIVNAAPLPGDYTPGDPTTLQNTTGNYWINYTWNVGGGNVTDSYNVSWNLTWYNTTTTTFMKKEVGASNWANITVYAYNVSGNGSLSTGYVSDETQAPVYVPGDYIPPNPTTLQNTTGNYYVNYTWVMGVPGNITDSYNVSWNLSWFNGTLTTYMQKEVGASNWANITVYAYNSSSNGTLSSDSLSDETQAPAYVPGDYIPATPTTLANTTGNYYVNFTWSSGGGANITDTYNVSWNTTWYNTTLTAYMQKEVGASNWGNITVYAYNISGNGTLSTGSLSDNVQAPAYVPGDYPPATPTSLANTTGNGWVNYTWSSGGGANATDSYNVSWNLTWYNTTLVAYMNDTVGEFGWANISVWAYNTSGNGSLSVGDVSDETQADGGTYITSMTTTVYNLITYYGSSDSSAEQFGIDISSVDYIALYNGSFYSHTMGFSANNFTVYHGIGYYVYLNATGSSTYQRNNISDSPYNTQLYNRWNTIGWTNATDTNAEGVAASIGSSCDYTSSLNADGVTYTTHTVGFASNNHLVAKGKGYWVWVDTGVSWSRSS